jgi:hypothetical protein
MSAVTGTPQPAVIDPAAGPTLVRMLRAMFPHERVPDGPYERTRDALLADAAASPRLAGLLAQGARDLDQTAGRPFAELSQDEATALLLRIEASPFFLAVKGKAVTTLYNDPELWRVLGYEGPSFALGGYLNRGFNDLDWLPEPPL